MSFTLQNVSVRHLSGHDGGAVALSNLNLSLAAGEQVALIGPSGAGKTTLLHTLACALNPAHGVFTAFGMRPWKLGNRDRQRLRARVFLAPQTPPLPPRQRVINAVLAGKLPMWNNWRAIASLIKPSDPKAAYDALRKFNLQEKLYVRVDRLSGGERQRCGMARLLVSSAEAFLVDEPLSALDPILALQSLDILRQEAANRGATLVCSLHQVELARNYFPRLIGLREGKIIFDERRENITDGMIAELYRNAHSEARKSAEELTEAGSKPDGDNPLPPVSRCF